jgi:DNA-binding transcriptional ArsR family regulator
MPGIERSSAAEAQWVTAMGLADVAALLADRTRARFCTAMLDGRAWTARELGALAGVAASTTSEHLSQLVAGGLLVERRQGRHRYVQLASPEVAEMIEDLAARAPAIPAPVGLRAVSASEALARARTCYDHLAGRLGVAVTEALVARGVLADAYGLVLTERGLAWFRDQLDFSPHPSRRPLTRACLDWTERRSHLAGQAGAHLRTRFVQQGWISARPGGRAVRLTPDGRRGLHELLGLDPSSLAPRSAGHTSAEIMPVSDRSAGSSRGSAQPA